MDDTIFHLMKLKSKGFCCSQMILMLALEAQGKANPDLVRSMGGLCFGVNGAGDICGALSGGACLISFYAGKGADEEKPDSEYLAMMDELLTWFGEIRETYGGTRCDKILNKYPDRSICGTIVADTYGKCMEILTSHGFDPVSGKHG
jgi:C_GCAxxG_C_C family probable redox protein